MHKKTLYKDILREIKKTLGRFISIVLLIAIGVLAFTGLRITGPDMLYTTADYMEEFTVADAIIQSTYGLNKEDVAVLEQLENVAVHEFAYQQDVFIAKEQRVMRVHSLTEELTTFDVKSGRLPIGANEIAVDHIQLRDTYKLGDQISFVDANNKPATDNLKQTTFTIVGFVQSPDYLVDGMRGNTTLGSGSVHAFGVVPKAVFDMDIYTSALLQFKSTKGLRHYSKAFEEYLAKDIEIVEDALKPLPAQRLQQLKDDAYKEISKTEKELDDADKLLTDASRAITEAEAELAEGVDSYYEGLATYESEISRALALIATAKQQLASGKITLDEAKQSLADAGTTLANEREKLLAAEKELAAGLLEIADGKEQLVTALDLITQGFAAIEEAKQYVLENLPLIEEELAKEQLKSEEILAEITAIEAEIAIHESAGEEVPLALTEALADANARKDLNVLAIQGLEFVLEEAANDFPVTADAIKELEKQQEAVQKQLDELLVLEADLLEKQKQVADGLVQITEGEAEIAAGLQTLASEEQNYQAGVQELATQEYIFAIEQANGLAELQDAEAQLAEGRAALEEAKASFAAEQPDAKQKIADGRKALKDARKKVDELKKPLYMVDSIANAQSYTMMEESTTGLDVLGIIFPIFVFFVATLVCLTTMSRMVEEQRMLMGTLKQLGYSNKDIRKKYLFYAFSASTIGVLIGLYLGHVLLPQAVFTAYETMLGFAKFTLHFSWMNSLISFVIAYLCTVGVAYYVTGSLLRNNTSNLLRGPAPANGSRILLERIPFIWKRMSFTYKVTFRNLFRYKQRMFMTIVGVAGCTALIMMGIGLHDSIANLRHKQFVEINQYDVMLMFDEKAEDYAKLTETITADPSIVEAPLIHMEALKTKVDGLSEQDIQIVVPEDVETFSKVNTLKDRKRNKPLDLATSEIIVTEKLMKMFDMKIGDTIIVRNLENEEFAITPVALTEEYTQNKVYMTKSAYEQVFGKAFVPNGYTISLKEGGADAEEAFAQKLQENKAVTMMFKTSVFEEQIDQILGSLNAVFFIIIFLASLLATVVLYNLTNINVAERMRELSTIKVLGFYNKEVTMYIYRESIILTLLGIALGFIPGKMLHTYICFSLPQGGTMFPLDITWQNYVLTPVFVILVSLGVMYVMHRKIKKVDMVEALKSVE